MQDKARELAYLVAAAADDKRAKDIRILKVEGITLVTDYFVICSGNSTTQVQAIADGIGEKLKEAGQRAGHIEGYREAKWVLLDLGSVVVHIFTDAERDFYDLERLWGDAESIGFTPATTVNN
ncbi:MAG: ribosome silencing factor [bacterium]|jgi:ribosome-associated protein